jgi:hypothetical protein
MGFGYDTRNFWVLGMGLGMNIQIFWILGIGLDLGVYTQTHTQNPVCCFKCSLYSDYRTIDVIPRYLIAISFSNFENPDASEALTSFKVD